MYATKESKTVTVIFTETSNRYYRRYRESFLSIFTHVHRVFAYIVIRPSFCCRLVVSTQILFAFSLRLIIMMDIHCCIENLHGNRYKNRRIPKSEHFDDDNDDSHQHDY